MTLRAALTMRVTSAAAYEERRDSISHDWLRRLADWHISPILVPNLIDDPYAFLADADPDLVILTGGDDVGATPDRDETERRILLRAMETALPVLGVCRGLQLINLSLGGRLRDVNGHVATAHTVDIAPAWSAHYPSTVTVNSFHARGLTDSDLAGDLMVTARDAEGRIEGVRHRSCPVAAVMWHTERAGAPSGDRSLVEDLVMSRARTA